MIKVWEHQPAPAVGGGPAYIPIYVPLLAGGVSEVIYCPFCRDLWLSVAVAGMSSGESMTARVMGSLDGVNFGIIYPTRPHPVNPVIQYDGVYQVYYHGAVTPYIYMDGFTATVPGSAATVQLMAYFGQMV